MPTDIRKPLPTERIKPATKMRKHDFIGIKISDPYEIGFPNIGMFKVEDSETGDTFWADTSNQSELKQMNNMNREKNHHFFQNS